jgi:c-di-GMP-related signal transduction protein
MFSYVARQAILDKHKNLFSYMPMHLTQADFTGA